VKFTLNTFLITTFLFLPAGLLLAQGGCVSPPSGLVAWWPGNGNAVDVIGSNNGSLVGNVTFTNGEVGQAFVFNGSDNVQVPNSSLWNFGSGNFSIELWANFSSSQPGPTFVADDDGAYEHPKWAFWWNTGGLLSFHINGNGIYGGTQIGQIPFSPTVGKWYHFAVTRSGSTFTFYVNGVQVGTGSDSESVPYISAPLTIGMAEGQFYFNGMLDEVSIYNRALSSNEVATIYSAGQSGKCLPSPFTVTNQPASISVSTGGTANFSVGVTGLSPFSFQWVLNGTNISGATNASLTLTNVSAANIGVYTATITNPLGSLTSVGAILTTVDIKMFAGIIINGVVGTNYTIESTSALQATNWMILTNTALPSLPYIYIDYSSITNPLQFYRAFPAP
jgi:concanavalin A-like lectin/glucanase superfamily protein/immunoglobulin I-set domain protein